MNKMHVALIFVIAFLLLADISLAGPKEINVRIWLFQGTLMEGQPGLAQVEFIPLSSNSKFASLKASAGDSENAFKASVIDFLLDAKSLRTLDDLFFFKQTQREDLPFRKVVLGREIAYRINLAHKVLTPTQVALHLVLSKTKEGVLRPEKDDRTMLRNAYNAAQDEDKMQIIADQVLTLGFDDPAIVSVPHQNRPYFLVVKLTAEKPGAKRKASPTLKAPPAANLVPAPQPVDKVFPLYPNELRRRGVQGDVGLRVSIDEKGIVQMVQVLSSLHPYLDYTASQAFWSWKFEPVLRGGKPVRAAFNYTFTFDPAAYSQGIKYTEEMPEPADDASRKELEKTLHDLAEYCKKMADAALFFVCEETIKETNHFLKPPDRLATVRQRYEQVFYEDTRGMIGILVDSPQIMDPRKIERLIYNSDYQLIRRFGDIKERRILLNENGLKIKDEVKLLEEDRYSVLSPVVSLLKIFDNDHQSLFNYRILKEDRVFGKDAYILEAVPKFVDADDVRSAKVWVDKKHFQILRGEIEGVPLDGYDDVLSDAILLNVRPFFLRTYEFQVEKNGVLFQDQTSVRIEYPSLIPNRRETKSVIKITYKNFKFFAVETEQQIKK